MSHILHQLRSARTGIDRLLAEIGRAMALTRGASITVHTRDAANDTPLHYAAHWGDVRAIEILVAAGAEIDAHGAHDATPLLTAVTHGHYAAAVRLLELGASADEATALGSPASAAAQSHDERLRALFAAIAAQQLSRTS